LYEPAEFVTVSRRNPVAVDTTITFAPWITDREESVTVPFKEA
jgi:hypothetical protein